MLQALARAKGNNRAGKEAQFELGGGDGARQAGEGYLSPIVTEPGSATNTQGKDGWWEGGGV